MSNEAVDLQARIEQLESMLEKYNAEKQQWKQCAHTLADLLEENFHQLIPMGGDKWARAQKALKQFKNLQS